MRRPPVFSAIAWGSPMSIFNPPEYAPPARAPLAPAVHDGLAVASLVLSLVWLGGLGSLLAVIFGHSSNAAAKREGRRSSQMANWGLILGYLGLALIAILVIVLIAAAHSTDPTQQFINCMNAAIQNGTDPNLCPSP